MIIGNKGCQKKVIYKHMLAQENGHEKSLLDHVLVESILKKKVNDVIVRMGAVGGMSDHYLVEFKVRVYGY